MEQILKLILQRSYIILVISCFFGWILIDNFFGWILIDKPEKPNSFQIGLVLGVALVNIFFTIKNYYNNNDY